MTKPDAGWVFVPPAIGHNHGPPLDEDDHVPPWGRGKIGTYFGWRRARSDAFKVSHATAVRRVKAAQACGLTYDEYVSVLLDTGRYLQPNDVGLIAEIKARRR